MANKQGYDYSWDAAAGVWQVCSPSGHVLCQASAPQQAAEVCARLNRRFAGGARVRMFDRRRFLPRAPRFGSLRLPRLFATAAPAAT